MYVLNYKCVYVCTYNCTCMYVCVYVHVVWFVYIHNIPIIWFTYVTNVSMCPYCVWESDIPSLLIIAASFWRIFEKVIPISNKQKSKIGDKVVSKQSKSTFQQY